MNTLYQFHPTPWTATGAGEIRDTNDEIVFQVCDEDNGTTTRADVKAAGLEACCLFAATPDLLAAGKEMLKVYAIYHDIRTSDFESGEIEEGAEEEYRAYNLMRMAVAKAAGEAQ